MPAPTGVDRPPPRVVLGVSRRHRRLQGVRAAAALTETGHDVRVVPTAPRAAVRRRSHLRGAVRPPGHHRASGTTCTRCRTCGSASTADLVVVAPATADLLARAAHGRADDLLTNTLLTARCPVVLRARRCTPRCGSTRPPEDNVATLRRRGVARARARRRPADRRGHRHGPAARARGDRRGLPAWCWPRGAAAPRPGRPPGAWSPPAAPASRSTRSASSATAPRAGRATPWPGPPPPAAPRSSSSPPTSGCPTPAGADVVPVGTSRGAARGRDRRARRRRRRRRDGRRGRRLPAGRARWPPSCKKSAATSRPSRSVQQPRTCSPSWSGARRRRGAGRRLGRGRLRRRDRRRRRRRARPRPGQARPQGLRPAGGQRRRSAGHRSFGRPDNAAVVLAADGAGATVPRAARTRWPPRSGTRRRRSRPAGASPSGGARRRLARREPARTPDAVSPSRREPRVSRRLFTSESVTEGHPDKIADQISDAHPRRAAHRRTRAAGSRSRR